MYESFSTVESIVALLSVFPGCDDFAVGIDINGKLHNFDVVFDPENKVIRLCNLE